MSSYSAMQWNQHLCHTTLKIGITCLITQEILKKTRVKAALINIKKSSLQHWFSPMVQSSVPSKCNLTTAWISNLDDNFCLFLYTASPIDCKCVNYCALLSLNDNKKLPLLSNSLCTSASYAKPQVLALFNSHQSPHLGQLERIYLGNPETFFFGMAELSVFAKRHWVQAVSFWKS